MLVSAKFRLSAALWLSSRLPSAALTAKRAESHLDACRTHPPPPPDSNHVYVSRSHLVRTRAAEPINHPETSPSSLSSAHSEQLQTLHGSANLTFRDRTRRRNPRHPPRVPEQCRARACRGSTAPPAPRVSLVRPLSPEPTILRPISAKLTRFAALALPRLADATFFLSPPRNPDGRQDACGIVTCGPKGRFYQCKGNGMVRDLLDAKSLSQLIGGMGVGHGTLSLSPESGFTATDSGQTQRGIRLRDLLRTPRRSRSTSTRRTVSSLAT